MYKPIHKFKFTNVLDVNIDISGENPIRYDTMLTYCVRRTLYRKLFRVFTHKPQSV